MTWFDHVFQLTNRECLQKTITDCVMQTDILNQSQCSHIVMFMVDNCSRVFTVPNDVRLLADRRILALKCGKLDPILGELSPHSR